MTLRGGKRLDDIDGLVDSVNSVVFVLQALNVLQRNLSAPQLPQDKIEVEKEHFQVFDGIWTERGLGELLKSIGHVLG